MGWWIFTSVLISSYLSLDDFFVSWLIMSREVPMGIWNLENGEMQDCVFFFDVIGNLVA